MNKELTLDQENERINPELVKQKVDEANDECWKIMLKKALEAGIPDNSRSMWLFYNRVNSAHFAVINNVRSKVSTMMFEAAQEQEK